MVTNAAFAAEAPALASASASRSTVAAGETKASTTTLCCFRAFARGVGTPFTTAGCRLAAFIATFGGASAIFVWEVCFRAWRRGMIWCTGAADGPEPWPSMRKTPTPRTSTPRPTSAGTRSREFTRFLSASQAPAFKKKGRGFPRPFADSFDKGATCLAIALLDVGPGTALVVEDGRGRRVDDAVGRRVGDGDLDVLDPCVVRSLQLGQGDAGVARGVVGVERLHARHRRTDVRLRS